MVATQAIWFNDNASLSGSLGRGALRKSATPNLNIEVSINDTDLTLEYDLVASVAASNSPSGYPGTFEQRKRITGLVKDLLYGGKDIASFYSPGGKVAARLSTTKIQLIDVCDASLIKEGDAVVLEPSDGNMTNAGIAYVSSIDNDSNAIVLVGTNLSNATAGDYIKVYHLYEDTSGMAYDTRFQEGGLKHQLEKPFCPTAVNVSVRTSTSVRVSWTKPACSNASAYHVYWNSGFNNPDYTENITPASGSGTNDTGLNLTDLTTDEKYTLVVVARDTNDTQGYKESRPSSIVMFNMTTG